MTAILDLVAKSRASFTPEDWKQYVALQLARRIQAVGEIHMLVAFVDQHSLEDVGSVYRRIDVLPLSDRPEALKALLYSDH